jgi:hypothetical protein
LDVWTDRKGVNGVPSDSDQQIAPPVPRAPALPAAGTTTSVVALFGGAPPSSTPQGRVTSASFHVVMTTPVLDHWKHLDIPEFLRRQRLGAPAISAGPDDDLGDLQ